MNSIKFGKNDADIIFNGNKNIEDVVLNVTERINKFIDSLKQKNLS